MLGLYYMTRERAFAKGEGKVFASPDEVRAAYDHGEVDLQAKIRVPHGRQARRDHRRPRPALRHRPASGSPFDAINKVMGKKQLAALIDICYRLCGEKETVLLADRLRVARLQLRHQGRHLHLPSTTW